MSDVKIDTQQYAYYEERFAHLSRRLSERNRDLINLKKRAIQKAITPLWADNCLSMYSVRLNSCKRYLRETMDAFDYIDRKLAQPDRDPVNYNPEYTMEDLMWDPAVNIGKCVAKGCQDVGNWFVETAQGLADAWNDFIKDPGKYVHAIIKGAIGAVQIAVGIALIATGAGSVAGALMIVNGANDLINAGHEAIMLGKGLDPGDYDFLKDSVFGGGVGGLVSFVSGDKNLGNAVGTGSYIVYEAASWILPGGAAGGALKAASKGTGIVSKACKTLSNFTNSTEKIEKFAPKLAKAASHASNCSDAIAVYDSGKAALTSVAHGGNVSSSDGYTLTKNYIAHRQGILDLGKKLL